MESLCACHQGRAAERRASGAWALRTSGTRDASVASKELGPDSLAGSGGRRGSEWHGGRRHDPYALGACRSKFRRITSARTDSTGHLSRGGCSLTRCTSPPKVGRIGRLITSLTVTRPRTSYRSSPRTRICSCGASLPSLKRPTPSFERRGWTCLGDECSNRCPRQG